VHERRADKDFGLRIFRRRSDTASQGFGIFPGAIHLPISRNQRFSAHLDIPTARFKGYGKKWRPSLTRVVRNINFDVLIGVIDGEISNHRRDASGDKRRDFHAN